MFYAYLLHKRMAQKQCGIPYNPSAKTIALRAFSIFSGDTVVTRGPSFAFDTV